MRIFRRAPEPATWGALALLAVSCAAPPATTPEAISDLLRDAGGRPLAGRLSIETSYRPCEPATAEDPFFPECAPPPLPDAVLRRLDRERRRAFAALRGDPRPAAKHASALLALLVEPRRDDLLRARERLEEAAGLEPESAAIHNDLAVVLLALAAEDATALPVALEHARTALAQRPDDPAGRWNAALVAQAVPLLHGARRAWDAYLALGGDPGWADEARRRRDQIGVRDKEEAFRDQTAAPASADTARALVRDHPDRAAGYLLENLLPAWAAAVSQGDSGAVRGLRRSSELLAEALHDVLGDGSGLAAVSQVAGDAAADAPAAYARGRAALLADDLDAAEAGLREVLRRADAGPLAAWSRVWLALIAVYRGEHERRRSC